MRIYPGGVIPADVRAMMTSSLPGWSPSRLGPTLVRASTAGSKSRAAQSWKSSRRMRFQAAACTTCGCRNVQSCEHFTVSTRGNCSTPPLSPLLSFPFLFGGMQACLHGHRCGLRVSRHHLACLAPYADVHGAVTPSCIRYRPRELPSARVLELKVEPVPCRSPRQSRKAEHQRTEA